MGGGVVGYSLEVSYGSLVITHSSDDEVREALANGVYTAVLGEVSGRVFTAIESGMLDDVDSRELRVPEVTDDPPEQSSAE